MGRKIKISYEDKLKACEDYINGIASSKQIAERLNLSSGGDRDVLWWVMKYRANGPESLMPKPKNSSYTKEFKIKTVEEYLSGSGSQEDICNKYQIPSTRTLRQWIAKYNDLEELKDYIPKPEVYTKMAYRKTTQEEREEIVVKETIRSYPTSWLTSFGTPITYLTGVNCLEQVHYSGDWDVLRPAKRLEEKDFLSGERLAELMREAEEIIERWAKNHDEQ